MRIELTKEKVEFITLSLRILEVELADSDPGQAEQVNNVRLYLQNKYDTRSIR